MVFQQADGVVQMESGAGGVGEYVTIVAYLTAPPSIGYGLSVATSQLP